MEEEFWVDDGCIGHRTSEKNFHGSFHGRAYEAGVRCCAHDGSSCTTPLSCANNEMRSYDDAVSTCSGITRRLCSKDELLDGLCCGSGGDCDVHEVWTSTGNRIFLPKIGWLIDICHIYFNYALITLLTFFY